MEKKSLETVITNFEKNLDEIIAKEIEKEIDDIVNSIRIGMERI